MEKILLKKASPDELPKDMQNQLKAAVHNTDMVKSTPLRLAGDGWRKVYSSEVYSACRRFNTPTSDKLNDLFKKWLGVKKIAEFWTGGHEEIDKFVELRGEIAHRGGDARPVSRDDAVHLKVIIARAISDTDHGRYEYLKRPDLLGAVPWQRTKKE